MVYRKKTARGHKSHSALLRLAPLVVIGVVLLIILIAILEATNKTHIFHKRRAASSSIPASTPAADDKQPTKTASNTSASNNTTASNPKSPGPSGSTEPPRAPSGNFVSNHHPSLSNTESAPRAVQSVCNTSPGATCTITFTSNGVTKTLESKTANADGLVIWNWDIISAGFVEGSWQITATASLNGKTAVVKDSQSLEVSS